MHGFAEKDGLCLTGAARGARPESLPWEAFPPSFAADVETHLAQLAGRDLLDEDAPDRSCKQSTIDTRRNYLRLAASAAVKRGIPAHTLRTLADLVAPETVRAVLEHYIAKAEGQITTFAIDMAERLRSVARRYVKASDADVEALNRFCRKLGQDRRTGLTPKNMAVVRRNKDPETRRQFLALPNQLFNEALTEKDALIKAVVKAEFAVAM